MRNDEDERLQNLELFVTEYASVIDTALRVYAEDMTANAKPLEVQYDQVYGDPELRARQDNSWVTTMGLKHLAALLRDSASQALRARAALARLEEEEEDDG